MQRRKTRTVYLVQTVGWFYNDEFHERANAEPEVLCEYNEGHRTQPIRAFLTREAAEKHAAQLDRNRRGDDNPFFYGSLSGSLSNFTELSEKEFAERLRLLGLSAIEIQGIRHLGWQEFAALTEEQRHGVWDALTRVRFHEVVPMEVEVTE